MAQGNDQKQPPSNRKNPYKEGTRSFLVAEALMAGETDKGKIVRQLGVMMDTVYNVTSELRRRGIKVAMHEIHKFYAPADLGAGESSGVGDPSAHGVMPSGTGAPEPVTPPADPSSGAPAIQAPVTPQGRSPSSESPSVTSRAPSVRQPAEIDYPRLAQEVVKAMAQGEAGVQPTPPGKEAPVEDVELIGEKVNYKIALNPEIFYRYSIFKAQAARMGRQWNGSLSDWIDLCTKDILAHYGMYPTVMYSKGRTMMIEVPVTQEERQ